ncbi:hypothetical protein F441_00590 [Phytophthora nicotianae CJ01A1]|uniref:Uncharacterized protein n=1 Tax=Phytophthora nicotianae CJ01A1 TaxID=1317063 RepID=W2XVC8_PHYNI|nr:hypothetical protein F441_00590 [Phytophthora nicotianae CJ01A1]
MSLLLKDVQKGNPAYNKIRDLILGMIDPLACIVVSILSRRPSVLDRSINARLWAWIGQSYFYQNNPLSVQRNSERVTLPPSMKTT